MIDLSLVSIDSFVCFYDRFSPLVDQSVCVIDSFTPLIDLSPTYIELSRTCIDLSPTRIDLSRTYIDLSRTCVEHSQTCTDLSWSRTDLFVGTDPLLTLYLPSAGHFLKASSLTFRAILLRPLSFNSRGHHFREVRRVFGVRYRPPLLY